MGNTNLVCILYGAPGGEKSIAAIQRGSHLKLAASIAMARISGLFMWNKFKFKFISPLQMSMCRIIMCRVIIISSIVHACIIVQTFLHYSCADAIHEFIFSFHSSRQPITIVFVFVRHSLLDNINVDCSV